MGLIVKLNLQDSSEAKRIILAIIQEDGGSFEGCTRLYKAFYGAHLIYWRETGKFLTTHPIVCMTNGPGIDRGSSILRELEAEKRILRSERMVGPYPVAVYRLGDGVTVELAPEERSAVEVAINWVRGKTAAEASDASHVVSRTWREAEEQKRYGDELHIYLDALTDDNYERKLEAVKSVQGDLREFLG